MLLSPAKMNGFDENCEKDEIAFYPCETPGQLQGFKTPNPENPQKKRLKNYPPGPDPKFL